jgi:DNA-binding CsgD family transcriptional regulator
MILNQYTASAEQRQQMSERNMRIVQLYRMGQHYQDIAEAAGVSVPRFWAILRQMKCETRTVTNKRRGFDRPYERRASL